MERHRSSKGRFSGRDCNAGRLGEPSINALESQPMAKRNAVEVGGVGVMRGGRWLLSGVSFEVERGETVAVIGANGSGKSTLLRVLEGYEFPTEGRVVVVGEELGRCEVAKLRRRVKLVGSAGVSTHGEDRLDFGVTRTLLEVVLTGVGGTLLRYDEGSAEERKTGMRALGAVGLKGREGVVWGVASAGERTRTLLARARMKAEGVRTELLLLDEPTANLDPAAREEALKVLSNPPAGLTQMIVTHHVEELPVQTSRVLVLKEGKALAWGEADKVLTSKVLSEAFGLKMRVKREKRRWLAQVVR